MSLQKQTSLDKFGINNIIANIITIIISGVFSFEVARS